MATIDIGKLTFTHKGDYAGGTAYVANDVVYYNGSAYIAKTSTTGNLPTSTAHWNTFASGSGGIWNAGLSLGSANQVVAVNSGASALEFQNPASGKTLAFQTYKQTSRVGLTSSSSEQSLLSGAFTQAKANSKLLVKFSFPFYQEESGSSRTYFTYDSTKTFDNWSWNYASRSANTFTWTGHFVINGASSTGSKNWVIGWHSAGSNSRPAQVFCPNSSDDARNGQTEAVLSIIELDF